MPISLNTIARYDHLLRSKQNQAISEIIQFIAETNVSIAVGNVAVANHFTYAKALARDANTFKAVDLRHPCIGHAIGNDIDMKAGSNVIFLTGANMAGKSTWMKSIGIGMYLAHIGFPVAAQQMEFSIREGIYSSINVQIISGSAPAISIRKPVHREHPYHRSGGSIEKTAQCTVHLHAYCNEGLDASIHL